MSITIRDAVPDDVSTIVQFNQNMAQETEHRDLKTEVLTRGVSAVLKDVSKGRYFVAEENGEVIGQTMITCEWSDWRDGMFWWIQSVYVREDKRGAGVFTSLYRHIETMARKEGSICGLRLYADDENHRARRTYEKLGMIKTDYRIFEVVW